LDDTSSLNPLKDDEKFLIRHKSLGEVSEIKASLSNFD
jgi:hypothetical protein